MRKIIFFLFIAIAIFTGKAHGQYITIPDTAFALFLETNYPSCVVGSQLDTACAKLATRPTLNCTNKNISDIEGIQYFYLLQNFDCSNNHIDSIYALPPAIYTFRASDNQLKYIAYFPASIQQLTIKNNDLVTLPALPSALSQLDAQNNELTALPPLPANVGSLYIGLNQIDTIAYFPPNLNQISVGSNLLRTLPPLPNTITFLECGNNPITALPTLPNSLTIFNAPGIQVPIVPALPTNLRTFTYYGNNITSLPTLPNGLRELVVHNNQLVTLPALPNTITRLEVAYNNITSLPDLPDSLYTFSVGNNPIACLPLLKKIRSISFANTNITCLPNYGQVTISNPPLASLPLCQLYNTSGCAGYYNFSGRIYFDANNNCLKDGNDTSTVLVKVQLWENGQLLQQAITGNEGFYSFDVQNTYGNYIITIDSTNLPFSISCPSSTYYAKTIDATDSVFFNLNFGLSCKAGFDNSVQDIIRPANYFRAASTHNIKLIAGDLMQVYGALCPNNSQGQVTVVKSGPASVVSFAGLNPDFVNGDTTVWNVSDYGAVNIYNSFLFTVMVDTFAQIGDLVCFDVTVSPLAGDRDQSNNTFTKCFEVTGSYDPNNKEVFPLNDIDTTQEWLYYTVNFQNTGSAPALHVQIIDTLSTYIDPTAIQVLSASHDNYTQVLSGGIVKFNFPNINLPDSLSNEPASHGYINYKVKLLDNLPLGTVIENTAYIYFDFNAPIITNTTINTISIPLAKPTVTATALSACQGDTITLQTPLNPTYVYEWYLGNTSISNSNTAILNVAEGGSYRVQITEGTRSIKSDVVQVTFNNLPSITLSAPANDVCSNATPITLTALPSGGTYTGATVSGNTFNPANNALGINAIEYTYTDSNGCINAETIKVTVNDLPTVTLQFPNEPICKNEQAVDLKSYGTPINGFFAGTGVTGTALDVSATGTYTITYTYTDSNGCAASKQADAVVEECIGIAPLNDATIIIYPNPISGLFTISGTGAMGVEVQVFDAVGQLVYSGRTLTSDLYVIDASNWASGIYQVKLVGLQQVHSTRIVKLR